VDDGRHEEATYLQALKLLQAFFRIADPELLHEVIACAENLAADDPPPPDSPGNFKNR
jgi:hypothetical protein